MVFSVPRVCFRYAPEAAERRSAGRILVHNHCYRADEMAQMIDFAREFGSMCAMPGDGGPHPRSLHSLPPLPITGEGGALLLS